MSTNRLAKVTLTGADERTSLTDLLSFCLTMPPGVALEIGLLFTFKPEGRHRYPREDFLIEAVGRLGAYSAVHVCGRTAREHVLAGGCGWIDDAGRVQLNGNVGTDDIWRAVNRFREVITQHGEHGRNYDSTYIPRHSLLVDGSGGRGISPESWVRPRTLKPVGFAGGLSPINLHRELPKIAAVAEGEWWVDMESSLRDPEDWFSLDLAAEALTACCDWWHPDGSPVAASLSKEGGT